MCKGPRGLPREEILFHPFAFPSFKSLFRIQQEETLFNTTEHFKTLVTEYHRIIPHYRIIQKNTTSFALVFGSPFYACCWQAEK